MKTALLSLCLAATFLSNAFAQPVAPATLKVTVVDPSNAVIVDATVTLAGIEPATNRTSDEHSGTSSTCMTNCPLPPPTGSNPLFATLKRNSPTVTHPRIHSHCLSVTGMTDSLGM